MQVEFELQEKYKDLRTNKWVQPIKYICEFNIINNDDIRIVIDVKGREIADFELMKKMFVF